MTKCGRLFASALLLSAACAAQTKQNQSANPSVPTLKANTREVVLDLVVTDNSGKPVKDLQAGDVVVLEQGAPQHVSSFHLVDGTKAAKPRIPNLTPGVFYNGTEGQSGEITVLLLDALNTNFQSQIAGRQKMLAYVDKQRGQQMAVFGLTDSLLLLQSLTNDTAALHRAIERKGVKQTSLHPGDSGIDAVENLPGQSDPQVIGQTANVSSIPGSADAGKANNLTQPLLLGAADLNHYFEDFPAMQQSNRVLITLEALKSIGHWLSGYPGRKKLIWLSGGFPVQLNPSQYYQFTTQNSYTDEVKEAATVLTAARVSVYPIDANGLLNEEGVFSAAETRRAEAGKNPRSGPDLINSIQQYNAPLSMLHATMNTFAEQTGGRAFYGSNNMDESLAKSLADGKTYYALSYSPENRNWDGKYRSLQVKTKRAGLRLQYRRGYFALNPGRAANLTPAKITEEMRVALTSPLFATGLRFYGSALPDESAAPDKSVPAGFTRGRATQVRFMVNTKDVTFQVKEDNRHYCNLRYLVGVYRGEELVTSLEKTMTCDALDTTVEGLSKNGMLLHSELALPEGRLRLRLVVRDNLTGKMGSVDIPYPLEVASN